MYMQPKPKPSNNYEMCNKCNGTGLYVMEVRNGKPWSATGTQCWTCGGAGWKLPVTRRKRCPKCQMLVRPVNDEIPTHEYSLVREGADHAELITCKDD